MMRSATMLVLVAAGCGTASDELDEPVAPAISDEASSLELHLDQEGMDALFRRTRLAFRVLIAV